MLILEVNRAERGPEKTKTNNKDADALEVVTASAVDFARRAPVCLHKGDEGG
jgi:hypothetical protein